MYFTGLLFADQISNETCSLIQTISGIWVVLQIYTFILILLVDAIFLIFCKRKGKHSVKKKTGKLVKKICFLLGLIFIFSQIWMGYNKFKNPVTNTYTFEYNKSDNSEQKIISSYKMVIVSDLHLGYIVNKRMLEKYVNLVNAQHADIVVIAGDVFDYTTEPVLKTGMNKDLQLIKASKGVFFVPGNHDYKFDAEMRLQWIKQCGITILRDSVASVDGQLQLIGRDDRSQKNKRCPITQLLKRVDTSKPCIYFAHHPNDIDEISAAEIPLFVSGHTHYGQIFPFNYYGYLIYANPYGLKKKAGITSYTTSGLGLSGFPLRIGTQSEIVIFNINIY
jgi:predicted MPP superfamily phosphohydrolase